MFCLNAQTKYHSLNNLFSKKKRIREITKDVLKFNYDMIPNEQSQTNEQNDRKEIKKQNWLKLIKLHKWN